MPFIFLVNRLFRGRWLSSSSGNSRQDDISLATPPSAESPLPDSNTSMMTADSSPATLVQKSPTIPGNRKESTASDTSVLDLERPEMNEKSSGDLEAQQQDNQPVTKRFNVRFVSDATLGLSDGMTVPFALAAGLSSFGNARLVYLGGLAELIAGAISMGLGGYIAAKGEAHSYKVLLGETKAMIEHSPNKAMSFLHRSLKRYGLSSSITSENVASLMQEPDRLLDFLMRNHHEAKEPDSSRAAISALVIGGSYLLGGIIPLIPYFCVKKMQVLKALYWSIGIMVVTLFAFGWIKTAITGGWKGSKNMKANALAALQMVVIGTVAAGAAVGLTRAINQGGDV